MATLKLSTEADRLIVWMRKFKPDQHYITFPNSFGGQPITKILPKLAKRSPDGQWIYDGFEIRFPPLADVLIKHRDIKPDHLRAKLEMSSLYGKFTKA